MGYDLSEVMSGDVTPRLSPLLWWNISCSEERHVVVCRGSHSVGGIISRSRLGGFPWSSGERSRVVIVKPIFDHHGSVVAWLLSDAILDTEGNLIAFIYESLVYSTAGMPVGFFAEGYFWQRNGHAVAFIERASSGPNLPFVAIPPFPPKSKAGVIPPVPRRKTSLPARLAAWSVTPWSSYIRGAAGWQGIDLSSEPPFAR